MTDALDYMNQLMKWPDPPEYDPRWAKAVSKACGMIAERDNEIAALRESVNALEASLKAAGIPLYTRIF